MTQNFTHLENDAMKVTFTSAGAAITDIALKQHKADNGGPVILNERSHSNILSLGGWPGADTADFQSQEIPNGMSFTGALANGVKWQRTYTFGKPEENNSGMTGFIRSIFEWISTRLGHPETKPLSYTIDISDTLTNSGTTDVTLPPYSLSVGRAVPIYNPIEPWEKEPTPSKLNSQFLGSGWFTKSFHLVTYGNFNPSSIPLVGIKTADGKDEFSSKTIERRRHSAGSVSRTSFSPCCSRRRMSCRSTMASSPASARATRTTATLSRRTRPTSRRRRILRRS